MNQIHAKRRENHRFIQGNFFEVVEKSQKPE
jgi:hypothetical protein